MVTQSHGGFQPAPPDPPTTVHLPSHHTEPWECPHQWAPCPLASGWYQSMRGSCKTRVGLRCSFSPTPAFGPTPGWLYCHSSRQGLPLNPEVIPHLVPTSPGMVISSAFPLLAQQTRLPLVGFPYPCPHLCKTPLL